MHLGRLNDFIFANKVNWISIKSLLHSLALIIKFRTSRDLSLIDFLCAFVHLQAHSMKNERGIANCKYN